MIQAALTNIEASPGERGEQGPPGQPGERGEQGPPGESVDSELLEQISTALTQTGDQIHDLAAQVHDLKISHQEHSQQFVVIRESLADLADLEAQYEKLAARVATLEKVAPIVLVSEDESKVYWEREVHPGERVRLPGIEVHHVSGDTGKLKRIERVNLGDVLTIDETPISVLVQPERVRSDTRDD